MNALDQDNLKRLLSAHASTDMSILDVGCGIGENISLLKRLGYQEVVGTPLCQHRSPLELKQ